MNATKGNEANMSSRDTRDDLMPRIITLINHATCYMLHAMKNHSAAKKSRKQKLFAPPTLSDLTKEEEHCIGISIQKPRTALEQH